MKKGFTLVELLAVIVILSILTVVTVPVVNSIIRNANQHVYDENINAIKSAAYDWTLLNPRLLPENENESIIVYLGELKLNGNIDRNIKNPLTGNYFSNNTSVVITKINGQYSFEVNPIDLVGTDIEGAPLLVISGNIVDYEEVTQESVTYTVPSASAKTSDGEPISSSYISYQIFKDDNVVSNVDLSSLGVYTIKYSVTYNNVTGVYEKKVIVRDTTKPTLDVGENIQCMVDYLPTNEKLLEDVIVTDNSGEVITPTIRSEIKNEEGVYYVYYDATDSSGNTITKRKEVIVGEVPIPVETSWEFNYTGAVQNFPIPVGATYKLEVWGAQGGNGGREGAKGGYATGNVILNAEDTIYITVGGAGGTGGGGYNGGGQGGITNSGRTCGGGGGATNITTTNRGVLSNYNLYRSEILIVAGGGGGSNYDSNGGAGGGLSGITASAYNGNNGGVGGTQTGGGAHGGSFGAGGSTGGATGVYSGGGGGYFGGGYGSNYNTGNSAGGGSSYIGGVTDGSTIAGNASMPTHDGTSTMTGNAGHGYAKITLISY